MNKKIFPLFLILYSWSIHAQTTFQKSFGASTQDWARCATQTTDGGYMIVGHTGLIGYKDMYAIKTASDGNVQWTKTFGGNYDDDAYSVKQTSDGGYVIAGYTNSFGNGGNDFYLIRTDNTGALVWSRVYGNASNEQANSVEITSTGGFIVVGSRETGGSSYDIFIVKTDASGFPQNAKTISGPDASLNDAANSIVKTADGSYLITGYTARNTGYVQKDVFAIKMNNNLDTLWTKVYGGTDNDEGFSVQKTNDGGYIIAGRYSGVDGGIINEEAYLLKIDSVGNYQWSKSYGKAGVTTIDRATSVQSLPDGGYALAGYSYYSGGNNVILLSVNSTGDQQWIKEFGGLNIEEAYSLVRTADNGFLIAGHTQSFGGNGFECYLIKTDSSGYTSKCYDFAPVFTTGNPATITSNPGFVLTTVANGSYTNATVSGTTITEDSVLCNYCNSYTQEICIVTVDTTSSKNLVVWEKQPVVSFVDSFRIYRDFSGINTLIGSIPYSDLSVFVDTTQGVNPNNQSYYYRIAYVDTYGNECPLSTAHKTIHLQPNGNQLSWDNYQGFSGSFYYRILRDSTGNGNWQLIDSVPSSNFQYTDNNPPLMDSAEYVIEVVHPQGGCLATLKSVENHNSSRSNKTYPIAPPNPGSVNDNSSDMRIFTVYPNPNDGFFIVEIESVSHEAISISVENILGEKIYSITEMPHEKYRKQISVYNVHNGIYVVNLKIGNEIWRRRLLIQE